jgi:uncharacterized protein (DUF362 family)
MASTFPNGCYGITRRGFLLGATAGLAAGVPLTWYGTRAGRMLEGQPRSSLVPAPSPRPFAMPGPFPGQVVEVHHPGSVGPDYTVDASAVRQMVDRGMTELTGADHPVEAWRSLFEPDDVVGIKVNPVGRKALPGEPGRLLQAVGAISRPEVLLAVVAGLRSAGVPPRHILVFERYADEFITAGYEEVMREPALDGVRWYASAANYDDLQVDIAGFPAGKAAVTPELSRHVAGYDPEVFVHMGFCTPGHDPKDDRRFRTHLSVIVSRMVNKIVTIPVLKDHRSAGVTLALKNLSHGMNNNVARSHLSGLVHGGVAAGREYVAGPNQCNTFIPTAVSQPLVRQKATLHILDGLIGVYEGGPGCWNKTWGTWPHRGLFFATDPVALDLVGWDIIDRKREEQGWAPVGAMGLVSDSPAAAVRRRLAALGGTGPVEAAALSVAGQTLQDGRASEAFDRRQPEHILLAGSYGCGVLDPHAIHHRRVTI